MSTQLDSYKDCDDQDPTDELPVLDVAAYEATFLDSGDETGQFDTADFPQLRVQEAAVDEAPANLPVKQWGREAGKTVPLELTADVDIILNRITDLESQVVSLREENGGLQVRCDTLSADKESLNKALTSARLENDRLVEHRTLAAEMTARLEEKLRDQTTHAAGQISELNTRRQEEQAKAQRQHGDLERQLSETTQRLATLEVEQESLRDNLRASVDVAAQQTTTIEELQQHALDAESSASHLARQLAARLMENDSLLKLLEGRNQAVGELQTAMQSLEIRLAETLQTSETQATQLAERDAELGETRGQLKRRTDELADRDGRISQLCRDIQHATEETRLVAAHRDDLLKTQATLQMDLSASQKTQAEHLREIGELKTALQAAQSLSASHEAELLATRGKLETEQKSHSRAAATLESSQLQLDKARYELDISRGNIQTLTEERDSLLPLREQLETAKQEIERGGEALAQSRRELAEVRSELTTRTEQMDLLETQLATAQAETRDAAAQRDELQQALTSMRETVEAQQQLIDSQAQAVAGKGREVETLRGKLAEQAETLRGLNDDMRARDEQIETLRKQAEDRHHEESETVERITQAEQRVKTLVQLISHKNRKIASLKSDVTVYAAALAAIRGNLTRVTGEDMDSTAMQRVLEPVEHDGAPIALERKVTTIGRTIENDISLQSKLISRHHARLLVAPSGVIIEDTGSTNGCFVNGRQTRQQLMRDGDLLSLGGLRYRLCARPSNETRVRGNVIELKDVRSQAVDAET